MEKNYMHPEAIVEFEFLEEYETLPHYHDNPEILFVLEGELKVKTDQQEYRLSGEDFVLINAGRSHSYLASGNLLAVRFQISLDKLNEILHRKSVIFWCCSVLEKSSALNDMRKLLKDILFYNMGRGQKDEFYVNSLHYQLLGLLCGNFLLEDKGTDVSGDTEEDRMSKVVEYIRANYRNPISLQDVADELYLSTTYLSKYIRRKSGKGFVDLINSIRLSHAMEDLMYTEEPVIRIAMDNGFASVAALNKVFKETYQTTPSEYRKKKKKHVEDDVLIEKAAMYLHDHRKGAEPVPAGSTGTLVLQHEKVSPMTLTPLLNVGHAADVLKASTQQQILYCKEQLGIRYARIWNVFDEEMYLHHIPKNGKVNYGRLYAVLDFLISIDIKPYIELRLKHHRLMKTPEHLLYGRDTKEMFADHEERTAFFDDFFGHLARRYGRTEVSAWLFDYPIENDTYFEDHTFNFNLMNEEIWNTYLDEFDRIAESLRKRFPEGQIGGSCFPVQHFGTDMLTRVFKAWRMHRYLPNFISITSFPYQIVQEEGRWFEKRRTDLNFVKNDVEIVRSAMAASGFGHLPLHLTECNLTLSDRSYANDTLFRGSFIANTITQIYNRVTFFGVWNALDTYSDFIDSAFYLFGGSGILTKTGVPKPAAHALFFQNRLYRDQAFAKDGVLVTRNNLRHFKLMVNHLVNMNTAYYLKEESDFSAIGIEQMTESSEHRRIHVRIEDVEDGCWQIRTYRLNQEKGSVLNEWLNLNIDLELRMAEQEYLERICVPHLKVEKQFSNQGVLEFDIDLEPNEIQYLHVTEFK